MKARLTPRTLTVAAIVFLLALAAFGWFVLVSPKRAAAAELKEKVATAEAAVATARAALEQSENAQPLAVADIFRLATAMPADADMPGILLELSRLAEETGIEFQSITPHEATAGDSFQQLPVQLVLDGNFYELSDFLFRLRSLVGVRSGVLHATGRLFSVESLAFAEAQGGFPELTATLTVHAFVYGTSVPASPLPAEPPAAATEAPAAEEPATAAEASP